MRKTLALLLALISLWFVIGTAQAAEEKTGYVTSTGLYIRESASTKADALKCAKNGEKLTILKTQGDWYYVRYGVVYGYVAKKYVSLSKSGSSSSSSSSSDDAPDRIADLGKAPATTRIGDRGSDVKKLQQALKILGYYSGNCDGIFGENTEKAVIRFQKKKGLTQDGIAGKGTIRLLFGEEAADAGSSSSSSSGSGSSSGSSSKITEKLNWFDDRVASMIPKGTHFTIKDIRSGRTFRAKHLFGTNHMDAEPLTEEDTGIMKKCYGGDWSWDRRPILILCAGRVFAASMNGMPHGDQSIYDNDFDGQFCIHFVDSKTHGTDKVDPDHQAAINEAARAEW
ncbi:MAG: peptidoglycan-binding protein [Oscillospiraceae bacterium]|jgi:peptidoglycan hydrolase-like protein with peptidoglycan-binding domain|nr:peptidoglycan-binding protein [Oscillospiraceae bacterium]